MPESPSKMVAEFHHHVGAAIAASPRLGKSTDLDRCEFIEEEARELREAVNSRDLVGVADALADRAYTVYGAALHFGIDLDAAIAEVHRSNMTKSPAGDGKAVKGSSYSPPELASIVGQ
ncbi:hypothetical protein [Flexivirga sp. B27]